MSTSSPVRRRRASGPTDADLLFDTPGPRGRRRIALISGLTTVAVLALLAVVVLKLGHEGQLAYPKWRYFLGQSVVSQLLEAAGTTLTLGGVAAVLTFPLGIALGWLRLLDNRPIRWLVGLWIDAMRAVPMLLLVYFFLLVVPRFATISDFWKLALPIVMCTSATTAEVFRSGVRALDRGQTEAAWALGMSPSLTMRLILAPQALRLMLPTLITQMVTIIKGTTLAYVLAYPELMYRGSTMIGQAKIDAHLSVFFQTYVIIALLYIIVNWSLGALARYIESRTR